MPVELYGHPFSAYCQKVLIALYENGTTFDFRLLAPGEPALEAFIQRWPLKRMPVLVDADGTWRESSVIIEYLDLAHPGPRRLVPDDARHALHVRFMDRVFDNYVMSPMQRIVADHMRPPAQRDATNVQEAGVTLDAAYAWLDAQVPAGGFAGGDAFTLADCAAAPALFYADWVHPIAARFPNLRALRARLLARPAVQRVVDEARPYRHLFPPGAPARD